MLTPEEYYSQIKELGLDHLERHVSSPVEAKATLTKLRSLQKQLRQIKRNINLNMKAIRAEYRERASTAAAMSSTVVSLLGKRKLAGQMRADEKRRLSAERDRRLESYDRLKLMIDELLTEMDAAKVQLDNFIEEAKAEKKAQEQAANFCPQCGQAIDQSDKFCRSCGHRVN